MPSNTILINGNPDFSWAVDDSKMDELVQWLDKNGFKEKPEEDEPKESEVRK